MLQNYYPIYQIALTLQSLRTTALFFKDTTQKIRPRDEIERFKTLLETVQQRCLEYGLNYTSDMAKRILKKPMPETYAELYSEFEHLNDLL